MTSSSKQAEPSPPRGRRGRPSPERAAAIASTILDAATELFLREGYEGTSMDAVAERAGVPRTTLYRRYADKSALLAAVLEARRAVWAEITARTGGQPEGDLAQRLTHHVATTLRWASTDEVRTFFRVSNAALGSSGGSFRRDEVFGFTLMVDRIASDIAAFGPAEGIRPAEPRKVALAIMTFIAGWLELRDHGRSLTQAESEDQARYLVTLLIAGKSAW